MNTETWLSPMNKVIWLRAFRERATRVTLRDGRKFKVRYSQEKFPASDPPEEYAWVAPLYGYVPCGWFQMSKCTDTTWLTESQEFVGRESAYMTYLDDFLEKGYNGADVLAEYPALVGRKNATIRAGFSSAILARGKKARGTEVRTIESRVYLFRDPK